jgi:PhzF family phenazine biosynthesis protein
MSVALSVPIYTVDAFTDRPFAGNPAGVCLLEAPRDAEWMQSIAAEMNLSETAFLSPHPGDGFDLRWFTPTVEVALCGHATLASAHVLWESGTLGAKDVARFHTKSGLLTATRRNGGIELDFPAKRVEEAKPAAGLIEALGIKPTFVGRNAFDYFVEVAKESEVRNAKPDHGKLGKIEVRGVIVTSKPANGNGEVDFVSRFFAPGSGVDEDPVTGSAHCALAPYWAAKLDRNEMTGHQVSARGGIVRVRVDGDRVILGGTAVTVMKGILL